MGHAQRCADRFEGHVALPQERMPLPIDGTAMPVERVAWRTGFSPVQTTVFFPSEWLDPDSLPSEAQAADIGSVQMWDLTAGERIPCFAELDLFPQEDEIPSMIVRPLVPMVPGHRIAVVVTDRVQTVDGDPIDDQRGFKPPGWPNRRGTLSI